MQLGEKINLVVCQKSKVDDWIDHFETYYSYLCGGEYVIYDLTDKGSLIAFCETSKFASSDLCANIVGIINYDLAWRRKELLNLENFTLMLDESSLIQNETAKRTQYILKMQPKNVILLSGTPTGGKYERLWTQLHLLGWQISKDLYWKQFVKVEYLDAIGRSIPIVTGYKNTERLKRKMRYFGCQFLKTEDVFDLPDQIIQKIKVPASKEYKTFRKKKIVTVDGTELIGDTTLTKMLYERQLCGIYSQDKLKAFKDLVESTDDRLIVFYNFTAELKQMVQAVKDFGKDISVVNGSEKDLAAYNRDSDSITFVQYQAGAMGLNLQKACRMIFYTLPLSSELFEQAKKRIHRIGQKNTCFYYPLMVKGSVEEKILATLEMWKDFTDDLFVEYEKGV